VTYAGKVDGGGATLAIAARDGKAIAYLCDGRKTEAWLQGTAAGGSMSLTGKNGKLDGTYGGGVVTGSITVGAKTWTFRVPTVAPPSALYRATARVRNATVVAGWIYYNGEQVGVFTTNGGDPTTAPRLDISSGTAVTDGTTIYANRLDGS
jgi:hypothetical protein